MRKYIFIATFFLTTLTFCDNKKGEPISYLLKDSVVKEHLRSLDFSAYFDTTDINYKVLKAYENNDTNFFKKLHKDIRQGYKFKQQEELMDSCIHQIRLPDLKVDEAYRFIFTAAFCPYKLNVTVSKRANSANIHFIIYQYRWDTAICRVINEYDKKITSKNWEDFSQALENADFWGLKSENGIYGLDGSTLVTTGFIKASTNFNRPAKFNYVYRWGRTTLRDPFHLILKLSGNKEGCF